MNKAKIVNEWYATNPTEYQKTVVKKYVHQVMFIFFLLGFVFCAFCMFSLLLIGALIT